MISWKTAIGTALCDFVEQYTGTRPDLKPSRKAHLASGSFLRGNAKAAAQALSAHVTECVLLGAPLLARVDAENGWLLFYLTADAIDAYEAALPEPEEPDDSYFARRLWITVHHADAETPDGGVGVPGSGAAASVKSLPQLLPIVPVPG